MKVKDTKPIELITYLMIFKFLLTPNDKTSKYNAAYISDR